MRILIARCSARYSGRGESYLPPGKRSIILKEDGSVSIHNEKGNKPINYMKCANIVKSFNSEGVEVWTFDARHESLAITLHEVFQDMETSLIMDDPGLQTDGTERDLQLWLADHPQLFGEGFTIVGLEYPTGNGPVDIMALDINGRPVAIEVKRVAMVGAIDQVRRYLDALKDPELRDAQCKIDFSDVRGIIAAVDIRPKAVEWANKKDIGLLSIPESWKTTDREFMSDTIVRNVDNSIYNQKQNLFDLFNT